MPVPSQKNYYAILGVAENATADEIKKAFRRLAKKYHPDVTGGDKAKEAKFKEVNEAYDTLGDEKKKAEYDMLRKSPFGRAGFPGSAAGAGGFRGAPFPGGAGGRSVHMNFDLDDLLGRRGASGTKTSTEPRESFGDIMSDLFAGFGFGAGAKHKDADKGADVTVKAEVDLDVVLKGGEIKVNAPSGPVTLKVPPGADEGQVVRVAGKGQTQGKHTGDLLVEVHTRPHPHFRRPNGKGADLEVDLKLALDQAVLGGKVEVTTLEGKLNLTVPAGTSSGLKLRLKGKGLPVRGGAAGARGDLFAVVQIVVPRDVPPKARELIAEFAKLTRK